MTGCTEAETKVLSEAYFWAAAAVVDAAGKTLTSDPVRWGTWFSASVTQAQQDHVMAIVNDIKSRTLATDFKCVRQELVGTGEAERCNEVWSRAYVVIGPPVVPLVNICPSFFNLSQAWQMNTLIHEAAHLSLRETDHSADGTVASARALAASDLSKALRNAANFTHFAMNDPTLRPPQF